MAERKTKRRDNSIVENSNIENMEKRINRPASEKESWRLTCLTMGKDEKTMTASKNNIDANNKMFLEELGFSENTNGMLSIKAYNDTVESEYIKGKRVVQRRVAEDGNTLYEDKELVSSREESR